MKSVLDLLFIMEFYLITIIVCHIISPRAIFRENTKKMSKDLNTSKIILVLNKEVLNIYFCQFNDFYNFKKFNFVYVLLI